MGNNDDEAEEQANVPADKQATATVPEAPEQERLRKNRKKVKKKTQAKRQKSNGRSSSDAPVFGRVDQQGDRQTLAPDEIEVDESLQVRDKMRKGTVADYVEAMRRGDKFPALSVFRVGERYVLVDGRHRLEAARRVGAQVVDVVVLTGSRDDALLYAAGANASNGLRLSTADKRRAIDLVLKTPRWRKRSSRWIAQAIGVDSKTVEARRRKLERTEEIPQCCERESRDGRTIDTSNIGSKRSQAATSETGAHEEEVTGDVSGDGAGKATQDRSTEDDNHETEVSENDRPSTASSSGPADHDVNAWLDELERMSQRAIDHEVRLSSAEQVERLGRAIMQLQSVRDQSPQSGAGRSAT